MCYFESIFSISIFQNYFQFPSLPQPTRIVVLSHSGIRINKRPEQNNFRKEYNIFTVWGHVIVCTLRDLFENARTQEYFRIQQGCSKSASVAQKYMFLSKPIETNLHNQHSIVRIKQSHASLTMSNFSGGKLSKMSFPLTSGSQNDLAKC